MVNMFTLFQLCTIFYVSIKTIGLILANYVAICQWPTCQKKTWSILGKDLNLENFDPLEADISEMTPRVKSGMISVSISEIIFEISS